MQPTRRDALAASGAVLGFGPAAPTLTLTTFSADITVPLGHPLMGGGITPAKEVIDPLFAHGFVLRGVGRPVAFVALDWCEVRNGAYDLLRSRIATAVDTEPARVLLCALHQHDTPIFDTAAQQLLERHGAAGKICDLAFLDRAATRIAEAARQSLAHARPVTHLGTGQARVERIASNRRYLNAAGQARYDRGSACRDAAIRAGEEGLIDPFLKTLSFWHNDVPLVALSAYATHPMSYYGKGGVSDDFIGFARRTRQAATPGVPQLYASGCSGNVTAGKYNDGDPANRAALAERLANAMSAAWRDTKKVPISDVTFRSVPLHFTARSGPSFSQEELTQRLKSDARPFGQCLAALGLSWLERTRAGRPIDVPALDFGTAVLTVLPAEVYVEYQLFAQQQRPESFVLTAGYGECGPGYIPVARSWAERDSNLGDWCWVGPDSEAQLQAAIRAALRRA